MGRRSTSETDMDVGNAVLVDVEEGNHSPLKSLVTSAHTQAKKLDVSKTMKHDKSAMDDVDGKKELTDIAKKIPVDAEGCSILVGAVDFLDQPVMAFVRLSEGHLQPAVTEAPVPVRFIFLLLGPHNTVDYHEVGRSIATLMSNKRFLEFAYKADSRGDLLSGINEFLDDSMVLPPGDWDKKTLLPLVREQKERMRKRLDLKMRMEAAAKALLPTPLDEKDDDPLKRTGRVFGALARDVKRRYPKYLSDFRDALNFKCLAAFIFIYFAAVSPAITFGGLLSEKTDGYIGVTEMLLSNSLCGVFFALTAGQPLLIIGATGPILVFEEGLYTFCKANEIPYMQMRLWCGLWVSVFIVVVVAADGCAFVRHFTRFTEEIFSSLISLIFIFETFKKLYSVFVEHPLQSTYLTDFTTGEYEGNGTTTPPAGDTTSFSMPSTITSSSSLISTATAAILTTLTGGGDEEAGSNAKPNTALMSAVLMLGTYMIATQMRTFRNSHFLGGSARRMLGDYGVLLAIVSMVMLDYFLAHDTFTQKLNVPDGFSPTSPELRGWLINPLVTPDGTHVPVWLIFAAMLPAIMVFILIYMESLITGLIVNKSERNMKKGGGYHLDLFMIGINCGVCSVFGLPFTCAATLRSVTHVNALTEMSTNQAPGMRAKIQGVQEQRMTNLAVSALIGLSVLLGPVLRQIPLAVLFGIFLYMGVSSMGGIQLFERIELFFVPVKHHPERGFVTKVRTMKMHIFTCIQLLCLVMLWVVKSTDASLAFPFFLILMVPLRMQLKWLFTPEELNQLDRDEPDSDVDEDEFDMFDEVHMPV